MAPKAKLKRKQVSLEDVALEPLLKKPASAVGKTIKLPGEYWGKSCPPSDAKKLFICGVTDYSLLHKWDDGQPPSMAMQLTEMGIDGKGGNSTEFYMKYPMPFLKWFYEEHPDEKAAMQQVQDSARTPAGVRTTQAGTPASAEPKGPKTIIYDYLNHVSTERQSNNVLKHKFTCRVDCGGSPCGGNVTVFANATGVFFKHCRRKSRVGCEAHTEVLALLNESSARQVQLSDGSFVTVFNFEDCLPHHLDFMWMVAAGSPMRLNRNAVFRDFVRGFEPRAVLPHNETVHRLAGLTDEAQLAFQHARRQRLMATMEGMPFIGLQMDMWTDSNSGICYVAVHDSFVIENLDCKVPELQLIDELLEFCLFPYTHHTGELIGQWMVRMLLKYELPAWAISGVTPDGAADGRKGVRSVPGLQKKLDICQLHQLQRAVLYALGLAGKKTASSEDVRDQIRINRRVVQLSHQSREVHDGFRNRQKENKIPAHQFLSCVKTASTRWKNQYAQVRQNNLMRPIIEPVLARYKREHTSDTAVVVLSDGTDDSDGEVPHGPVHKLSKAVTRKDIGFTAEAWERNLELEGFLERPGFTKDAIERNPSITGAQGIHLMYKLQTSVGREKPLGIHMFPSSISLKHRTRDSAAIDADSLSGMIKSSRKVMHQQLQERFFDTSASETRLVQLYMSKQMPASKVLSEDQLSTARVFYLAWLRSATRVAGGGHKPPTRIKKSAGSSDLKFFNDSDDDPDDPVDAFDDDPVAGEARRWEELGSDVVKRYKESDGILNEFKLVFALRKEFPLHYMVFKQTASHRPHEGNAEETFSLSGRLSSDNTHTDPSFLSTLVRINKNKSSLKPTAKMIGESYKRKYRKFPSLGDDVSDQSESENDHAHDSD